MCERAGVLLEGGLIGSDRAPLEVRLSRLRPAASLALSRLPMAVRSPDLSPTFHHERPSPVTLKYQQAAPIGGPRPTLVIPRCVERVIGDGMKWRPALPCPVEVASRTFSAPDPRSMSTITAVHMESAPQQSPDPSGPGVNRRKADTVAVWRPKRDSQPSTSERGSAPSGFMTKTSESRLNSSLNMIMAPSGRPRRPTDLEGLASELGGVL